MNPDQKQNVIELIIEYIYLNFKKIEENSIANPVEDEAIEERRLIREKYNADRDARFGPRRKMGYEMGVDLKPKKKK